MILLSDVIMLSSLATPSYIFGVRIDKQVFKGSNLIEAICFFFFVYKFLHYAGVPLNEERKITERLIK